MMPDIRLCAAVGLALACSATSHVLAATDPCAVGGCLGPLSPALVDTNENGRPDPGIDLPIALVIGPDALIVDSPWHHDLLDTEHIVLLRDADAKRGGKYLAFERSSRRGLSQRIDVDANEIRAGRASRVHFTETIGGTPGVTGSAELLDLDGDGLCERLAVKRIGEIEMSFELTFVGADTDRDGHADYISIPWSQASVLGVVVGDGHGPIYTSAEDPQVWLPMADTDSDGAPDSVVLDLDGDRRADSKLFWTPRLATRTSMQLRPHRGSTTRPVVAMGIGLLCFGLCTGGWLQLRRRGVLR